jgi:hypothetical protein
MKKIKKKHVDKSQVGIIDVDLVDSIDMCNFYEVSMFMMLLGEGSSTFCPV